jgi:addiction module RelE/StbE family toxin
MAKDAQKTTLVTWSPEAKADFELIFSYLKQHASATIACETSESILAAVAHLRDFPQTGRVGRITGTREWVVSRAPYMIIYELELTDNHMLLLRILHTARLWPQQE